MSKEDSERKLEKGNNNKKKNWVECVRERRRGEGKCCCKVSHLNIGLETIFDLRNNLYRPVLRVRISIGSAHPTFMYGFLTKLLMIKSHFKNHKYIHFTLKYCRFLLYCIVYESKQNCINKILLWQKDPDPHQNELFK